MHPPQLMPGTDRSVCRRPASISRLARRSSSDDNRVRADTPVTASPNRAIGVPSGKAQPREDDDETDRSEEHTSELQSLMRISYAVFCLKKKNNTKIERY